MSKSFYREGGKWSFMAVILGLVFAAGCQSLKQELAVEPEAADDGVLTAQGESTNAVWQSLLGRDSADAWRGYGQRELPPAWQVSDGELKLDSSQLPGGDIVTRDKFDNFELEIEWKISVKGNSGIFYRVLESLRYERVSQTGPELQIIDNQFYQDTSSGDLCGLIRAKGGEPNPPGEWNLVRIIVDGDHVEHWLNGVKVVDYSMATTQWAQLVAASKFNAYPDFGKTVRGRIALQDHGAPVWYRNIRIRSL